MTKIPDKNKAKLDRIREIKRILQGNDHKDFPRHKFFPWFLFNSDMRLTIACEETVFVMQSTAYDHEDLSDTDTEIAQKRVTVDIYESHYPGKDFWVIMTSDFNGVITKEARRVENMQRYNELIDLLKLTHNEGLGKFKEHRVSSALRYLLTGPSAN